MLLDMVLVGAFGAASQLLISLIRALLHSLPVWIFWTYCEMGKTFGANLLPEVLQAPTMIHCLGFFIVTPLLVGFIGNLLSLLFGSFQTPKQ